MFKPLIEKRTNQEQFEAEGAEKPRTTSFDKIKRFLQKKSCMQLSRVFPAYLSFNLLLRSASGSASKKLDFSFNPRSLEGVLLALNFCSSTDCQKLWHNCSLFVNTSFDTNLSDVISDDIIAKSCAIRVLTVKSQFFARTLLNTYNFTMDSTYFVDFNR